MVSKANGVRRAWFSLVLAGILGLVLGLLVAGVFFLREQDSKRKLEDALAEKDRLIVGLKQQTQRITELEEQVHSLQQQVGQQQKLNHQNTPATKTKRTQSLVERLLFFPTRFPEGNWEPNDLQCEDCWFKASDGIRLHAWYFSHEKPQAAVLFVHGNAGNLSHRGPLMHFLRNRFAVSLLIFDYRGYGRSEGTPTVEGVLQDVRAARDYLAARENIQPTDIVLMGRSLGGAIAVDVAGKDGARGLILESTFSSLKEIASTHLPAALVTILVANQLDSISRIGDYRGPLLQSHGTADRTIPHSHGRKLFQAAHEPKQFVELSGRDHNDPQTEAYYKSLEEFFKRLPDSSAAK